MNAALLALLLAPLSYADPTAARRALAAALPDLGVPGERAQAVLDAPAEDAPYSFRKDGTRTECKTVPGKIRWRYCVTRTDGSGSRAVLYFLHGHDNGPESWASSGDFKKKIRERWKAQGVQAPIVVSVSFGGFWLLVDKNQSSRSGLLPFFHDEVIPTVEKDLGFADSAPERLLMGQSMGGYNAVQLILRYPALFSRAVLAFPAVAHMSPYASKAEVDAYEAQPGASHFKVWMMIHLARKVFKTEADYLRSDPFTLGQTELGAATPPLLLSVGDHDSFGLCKSVGEFVALARSRGVSAAYDVIAGGGHVSANAEHMADFLAK